MNCLVIKNDGIGDLILSSGILTELSNLFGGDLDLVVCEEGREIAEMISGIRKIYYVSRDDLCFHRNVIHNPFIGDGDKFILLKLGIEKYDYAICLRRFIRQSSLIIMNCISAEKKFCCWQFPTNVSWDKAVEFSKGWNHYCGDNRILSELKYYEAFCSTILNTNISAAPSLLLERISDKIYCIGKVVAMGISGGSVQPGALWIELAKLLADEGWTVHLFGGIQQSVVADFISKYVPSVVNHVGQLTFTQTINILSSFQYYVGNDTGLSHLASLVVPKNMVVLGGGTFHRFFPWPKKNGQHIIFYGLECYDCDWYCKYPSRLCLELIQSKCVLKYFLKMVQGERIPHLINLGDHQTIYQIQWRRSEIDPVNVKFYDLQKKIEERIND
jgi:ADP-heptose:LPS heptosyltransferase